MTRWTDTHPGQRWGTLIFLLMGCPCPEPDVRSVEGHLDWPYEAGEPECDHLCLTVAEVEAGSAAVSDCGMDYSTEWHPPGDTAVADAYSCSVSCTVTVAVSCD